MLVLSTRYAVGRIIRILLSQIVYIAAQISPARPALDLSEKVLEYHERPRPRVERQHISKRLWIVESWPSRPSHHLLNEAAARSGPLISPARSIAVARLSPNGLEIKKETTHDLV